MNLLKKLFALSVIASILALVPACNTVEGMGKDTQKAGEKIEDAAD
jgi:predicted small secreted protein